MARLETAGYATVGKANLHEFAWGITSDNPHFGRVPKPIAADRIAGGSSGGCAALAAGLAEAALGSRGSGKCCTDRGMTMLSGRSARRVVCTKW